MDWAGLASALAPGLGNLFGQFGGMNADWKNPADAAAGTLSGIPDMMKGYYQPYMQAGQKAIPTLQGQFGQLLSNPGQFMNRIGQSYQQSPGFQSSLKEALNAATNAAAAGGYAGSPQHERYNMETATNLANKDYNSWLSNALGLYGMGLGGEQGLYQGGLGASTGLAQNIADVMAKQAELQYQGQDAANKHEASKASIWDTLGGLAGAAIPFLF